MNLSDRDIRGSDGMDWQADLEGHEAVEGFWMFGGRGDSAAIRPDPTGARNNCLYMRLHSRNRMQCELNFKREADYRQIYVRYRVYWPESLRELGQYPDPITWFTFLEVWEHRDDDLRGNEAGNARWTFSFHKDEGVSAPLYWGADAQRAQPRWRDLWSEENRSVPIPFGRWALLEMYFKRGKGKAGRIWMAITPEGGEKQIIFDIHRDTEAPSDPMPLRSFQLWKLYTQPKLVRWMEERHAPISVYYDDFEWWSDIPPDTNVSPQR